MDDLPASPSLAAITVSVASSPIFLRMASSPLAYRPATYDESGAADLRASSTAASLGQNVGHISGRMSRGSRVAESKRLTWGPSVNEFMKTANRPRSSSPDCRRTRSATSLP